jgi:hypothetical protein
MCVKSDTLMLMEQVTIQFIIALLAALGTGTSTPPLKANALIAPIRMEQPVQTPTPDAIPPKPQHGKGTGTSSA